MISLWYSDFTHQLIDVASGIQSTVNNSSYTRDDFSSLYPAIAENVPVEVLDFYIGMANSCLSERRYGTQWKYAMGLFIAHFLTLYLQATNGLTEDSPVAKVLQNSLSRGVATSKSVDGVSVSYQFIGSEDLSGWADWKLTLFGTNFATLARLMGKSGMYVW